mmetsp:Transcript_74266/g.138712  ORF Transcript_74266/g.138712 Transcript_74266/m.138712 type:complete len:230 (+) Transcript_74266:68-757(+)
MIQRSRMWPRVGLLLLQPQSHGERHLGTFSCSNSITELPVAARQQLPALAAPQVAPKSQASSTWPTSIRTSLQSLQKSAESARLTRGKSWIVFTSFQRASSRTAGKEFISDFSGLFSSQAWLATVTLHLQRMLQPCTRSWSMASTTRPRSGAKKSLSSSGSSAQRSMRWSRKPSGHGMRPIALRWNGKLNTSRFGGRSSKQLRCKTTIWHAFKPSARPATSSGSRRTSC